MFGLVFLLFSTQLVDVRLRLDGNISDAIAARPLFGLVQELKPSVLVGFVQGWDYGSAWGWGVVILVDENY